MLSKPRDDKHAKLLVSPLPEHQELAHISVHINAYLNRLALSS